MQPETLHTLLQDLKKDNLKGLDAQPDTVNETIDFMNNYCAAPAVGKQGRNTTLTSIGVQFEQEQVPSAL